MLAYFLPISVLVLAGFGLGLLVGRLAWATPEAAVRRVVRRSSVPPDAESAAVDSASRDSNPPEELPQWQMKEVRLRRRHPSNSMAVGGESTVG